MEKHTNPTRWSVLIDLPDGEWMSYSVRASDETGAIMAGMAKHAVQGLEVKEGTRPDVGTTKTYMIRYGHADNSKVVRYRVGTKLQAERWFRVEFGPHTAIYNIECLS